MQVAFFFFGKTQRGPAPYTSCSAMHPLQVGYWRCGCRSGKHVGQLRFVGIGMRWSAVFVIVRFFRHSPYQRTLHSRLWFDLFLEQVASGVQFVGPSTASQNSSSLWARKPRQPVVHAWFLSQKSVTVHDHVVERAVEDGAGKLLAKPSKLTSRTERARMALASVWMQLLVLRKTVMSQGCKYDVLRGRRKHNTTCGKAAFMAAWVAPQQQTCLTTVHAFHVSLGFLRFNDWKRRHQTISQKKKHSIAVGLWARPPVLSHGHKNLLIDCGDDLLSGQSALPPIHNSSSAHDAGHTFHSPTSSSQALKPDSKPLAWSHQSAYWRFCV